MSQQEKTITVSITTYAMILGYYLYQLLQMVRSGGLQAIRLYSVWAVVIISLIIVNIAGNIIINVVLAITHAIKTQSATEPPASEFIEDERDKLVKLKGSQVSYVIYSLGVFAAMIAFVAGQPALVMFSLLILASILAEIAGDIAQIVLYRRGV